MRCFGLIRASYVLRFSRSQEPVLITGSTEVDAESHNSPIYPLKL
jgi:hypothetical protein